MGYDDWAQAEVELARVTAERDEMRRVVERVEALLTDRWMGAVMTNMRYAEGFYAGEALTMNRIRRALAGPESDAGTEAAPGVSAGQSHD